MNGRDSIRSCWTGPRGSDDRRTPRPDGGIPESVSIYGDWNDLKNERAGFDTVMLDWAERLDSAALAGELTWYSGAMKAQLCKPKWLLVTHMFNHQTHHRGQVHCMLTQAGGQANHTTHSRTPA